MSAARDIRAGAFWLCMALACVVAIVALPVLDATPETRVIIIERESPLAILGDGLRGRFAE